MTNRDELLKDGVQGQILTFYSFKGGVGRTMAMANVAFLAALNGLRVLIMDWDLEAPGLAYYYRGLRDGATERSMRDVPGVLDMLWEWRASLKDLHTDAQIEELVGKYENGDPFKKYPKSLIPEKSISLDGGVLDFIGAGGRNILIPESVSYEEALAKFSWNTFFEDEAGGILLQNLRAWSKKNYDLVFIDSRTGLADVAGICTMLMPDTVALAFVLNKQNIDGVAKVAGAIRANRPDDIVLRALPMRVTRQDTSEESDARARAISELVRVGGFSRDAVNEDFNLLSIPAADNVPFYETLAPFAAVDPNFDVLTFNYSKLATYLIGKKMELPELDAEFSRTVRHRLQPKFAATEYIDKLTSFEPARAISELERLILGAIETDLDGGELQDDYITALVKSSLALVNQVEGFSQALFLYATIADLLRTLEASHQGKWTSTLISVLGQQVDEFGFVLGPDSQISLLEEVDILISEGASIANRLKRIEYSRKRVRLYIAIDDVEGAVQLLEEIQAQLTSIRDEKLRLPAGQEEELLAAEIDCLTLIGDTYRKRNELDQAYGKYMTGLAVLLVKSSANIDLTRLQFELRIRLATLCTELGRDDEGAQHALFASTFTDQFALGFISQFTALAKALLRVPQNEQVVLEFCENVFLADNRQVISVFAKYYGHQPSWALDFLTTIGGLSDLIRDAVDDRVKNVQHLIAETCDQVLRNLLRRRSVIRESVFDDICHVVQIIAANVEHVGGDLNLFPNLVETMNLAKGIVQTGSVGRHERKIRPDE